MVTVTCPNKSCGIEHGIPEHVMRQGRQFGKERTITCPNGHAWTYTEADNELERVKRSLEQANANAIEYRQQLHRLRRHASALRGVITKLKRARRVW